MTTCSPHSELSRFDIIKKMCEDARSDTSSTWDKSRDDRIKEAQERIERIESRLSRKRRDFSKPNSGEKARAEAAKSQTTPVIKTGKPGRPRKTLYAWGDSPTH